jgi:hypothetical protein
MSDADREHPAPPAGEEIHLPGPSVLPILNALGISLMVVGTTLGLPFIIVGALLFLGTGIRWIADTRRDIDALPADHSAPH